MGQSNLGNDEIALIKALLKLKIRNQEILGYINNARGDVKNHINNGRITDIKKERIGADIQACDEAKAKAFMNKYGNISNSKKLNFLCIKNEYLENEESETLEFKETFKSIKEDRLLHIIQAMANNQGGFIVFGVKEEGQKSKKFIVNGLESKEIDSFMQDKKRFSEKLSSHFEENIKIERGKESIAGKIVGYIEVLESQNKPIINKNGDIYYRYDAETRKIKKLDLIKILENRETQVLKNTFYAHIETILKNGIENSAVINLSTGGVEGKSGNFLINESLLSKIAFVKEGEFVEKKGKPTLVLKGEVQPLNAEGVVIHETHNKNIDDNLIYECFLKQENIDSPEEFLKAIANSSSEWLPIYFYAEKAGFNKQRLQEFLSQIQGAKKLDKKIEHIEKNMPEQVIVGKYNAKYKSDILENKNLIEIINKPTSCKTTLIYVCNSIMELNKKEINNNKDYLLRELLELKKHFASQRNFMSSIKKAIAYIDRVLFCEEQNIENRNN